MNRAAMLAQAARGPVLLITIGVVFALQQSGGLRVSQTWPLFIIVIGVMKLIERMLTPRPAFPPPPPGGSYAPPPGSSPYVPPPGSPTQGGLPR